MILKVKDQVLLAEIPFAQIHHLNVLQKGPRVKNHGGPPARGRTVLGKADFAESRPHVFWDRLDDFGELLAVLGDAIGAAC